MTLKVDDIHVELGGKEILAGVNLEIRNGELFSLLGPSGCGKTTMLKTLSGLLLQSSGVISMDGEPIDAQPPEKRDMVVVFQDLRLFPNMNVVDNVAFPLKMRGVKKEERRRRASEVLALVQLEGFEKRRPSQLSGGQQQRVALARAVVAEPKVLLLDEPFSSLDENLRDDMRDLLTELHGKLDTTMVLVTHDQREALKLSDRIAIMSEGRVLQCGTPREIYRNPATLAIARYFADGVVVEGVVADGSFRAAFLNVATDVPDGPAAALVRNSVLSLGSCTAGPFMVKRADYLGDALHVTAVRDGVTLQLSTSDTEACKVGDAVEVLFDPSDILVFPA